MDGIKGQVGDSRDYKNIRGARACSVHSLVQKNEFARGGDFWGVLSESKGCQKLRSDIYRQSQISEDTFMKSRMLRHVFLIFSIGAVSGWAQSPDLKELKSKLSQLEQMMQDLKQQIDQAEAAQKTPGQALVAPSPQPAPSVPTSQVPVDHMGALTMKRQVASANQDSAARI